MNESKLFILGFLGLCVLCLCVAGYAVIRLIGPFLDALDAGNPWAVGAVLIAALVVLALTIAGAKAQ